MLLIIVDFIYAVIRSLSEHGLRCRIMVVSSVSAVVSSPDILVREGLLLKKCVLTYILC
jgi:hypothetical protein